MSVQSKKPDKPGYMSTEFWAAGIFALYQLLIKSGLEPEEAEAYVEKGKSAISAFLSGDSDGMTTLVVGAVIIAYGWFRTRLKRTKILADSKKGG